MIGIYWLNMAQIDFTTGDLLQADADALINAVNCVGIMGRGIALQFKQQYPANFVAYAAACKAGKVQPGRMFMHEVRALIGPRWIVNFPTKRHWKDASRMEDIGSGLIALAAEIAAHGIRSIALPALGAGLGGLVWGDVRPRIVAALQDLRSEERRVGKECCR